MQSHELPVQATDGHAWTLLARVPASPSKTLLWLPALGIAAKHYLPFAEALAARGVAVFIHDWRGNGSSSLRPDREHDWAYRELLMLDLPQSEDVIAKKFPQLPRVIGGHSLGGQLACCRLGLAPETANELWLVASGSPFWRAFPKPLRYFLPMAYRFLPWLANRLGVMPGRRLGFGGDEARGLIGDWARSGLTGRYAAKNLDVDLEAAMAHVSVKQRALSMSHDWLCPPSAQRYLLSKLSPSRNSVIATFNATTLACRADHFAWMQQPQVVADFLTATHA